MGLKVSGLSGAVGEDGELLDAAKAFQSPVLLTVHGLRVKVGLGFGE